MAKTSDTHIKVDNLYVLLSDTMAAFENTRVYISDFMSSFSPIKTYLDLEKVPVDYFNKVSDEKLIDIRRKLRLCYSASESYIEEQDVNMKKLLVLYKDVLNKLDAQINDMDYLRNYVSQMVIKGKKNESIANLNQSRSKGDGERDERNINFREAYELLNSEFDSLLHH